MAKDSPQITFALISDLQYAPVPPAKNRFFARSIQKLDDAISVINNRKPDFLMNLGDTIDRGFENFDEVLPHFRQVNAPVFHAFGNHDYEVADAEKSDITGKLGFNRYYHFSMGNWRFIVLDGNEISTFANLPGSPNYNEAEKLLASMAEDNLVNGRSWNGGISITQLQWLDEVLCHVSEEGERAILFCHYPVFPENKHNLLNTPDVLKIITKYGCVKAWFNGHNHHGNYGMHSNIHFITVKGMIESEFDSAWSFVSLNNHRLQIEGYGPEISASLYFD